MGYLLPQEGPTGWLNAFALALRSPWLLFYLILIYAIFCCSFNSQIGSTAPGKVAFDKRWIRARTGACTMSLSMEQVARLTKLSVESVFSQSDVKKLLKASDKNKARARTKVTAQKPKQKRTPLKETRKQAPLGIEKKAQIAIPVSIAKPEKKPFWSFLSPRTKQSKKVSLLEVKSPK
jgi:hypothetical protein